MITISDLVVLVLASYWLPSEALTYLAIFNLSFGLALFWSLMGAKKSLALTSKNAKTIVEGWNPYLLAAYCTLLLPWQIEVFLFLSSIRVAFVWFVFVDQRLQKPLQGYPARFVRNTRLAIYKHLFEIFNIKIEVKKPFDISYAYYLGANAKKNTSSTVYILNHQSAIDAIGLLIVLKGHVSSFSQQH